MKIGYYVTARQPVPTQLCPKCARPRTFKGHGIAQFGGDWYFVCEPEEVDGYQAPAVVLERCDRVRWWDE